MAKQQNVAEESQMNASIGFTLPNKKIHIKPIIKKGKWLSEEHSGNFMYDNTTAIITVPISAQTGQLVDPLTKEEREFFDPSTHCIHSNHTADPVHIPEH